MNSTSNTYGEPQPVVEGGSSSAGVFSRLGEFLVKRGRITSAQLDEALHHQRQQRPWKPLGQVIVDLGLVTEAKLLRDLADLVHRPFIQPSTDMVHHDALSALPAAFMEKHNLLPLSVTDHILVVATENFTDLHLIDDIERKAQREAIIVAAEPDAIRSVRQALLGHSGADVIVPGADPQADLSRMLNQIGADELQVVERQPDDDPDIETSATESPIVKLVNYIIKAAVQSSASDIHIEPDEKTFRVRYRIDGDLVETIAPAGHLHRAVVSRIKLLAGMDISERRLPQDGGVTVRLVGRSIDLRVSTMATRHGEKVVMRIVDRDAAVRSLDAIGMEPDMRELFGGVIRSPNGIVLITGPTGSGKSTTLYGVLAELVSVDLNISTIEDPVECLVAGTSQFPVNPQAGFTFATALRSLLRQDPDIIMVGEIRDAETARLATEAALTGHLVLSTLHTNDAPTAVPRLINMGIEPYLVAAGLRGVLAQRLVKKNCPRCVAPIVTTDDQRHLLSQLLPGREPPTTSYQGRGCGACRNTGTDGRIGLFDLLTFNESSLGRLTSSHSSSDLYHALRSTAPEGLTRDALIKIERGTVGMSALLEVCSRLDDSCSPSADRLAAAA